MYLWKNMFNKTFFILIYPEIEEQCPLNAYKFRFLACSRPFTVMEVIRGAMRPHDNL